MVVNRRFGPIAFIGLFCLAVLSIILFYHYTLTFTSDAIQGQVSYAVKNAIGQCQRSSSMDTSRCLQLIMDKVSGRLGEWTAVGTLPKVSSGLASLPSRLIQWTNRTYRVTNCSVTLVTQLNHNETKSSVTAAEWKKQLPVCTKGILKDFLRQAGDFPGEGHWTGTKDDPTFHPSFCHFPTNRTAEDILNPEHGVKMSRNGARVKIAVMGDSNGARLAEALVKDLRRMSFTCTRHRQEKKQSKSGNVRDARYFQVTAVPITVLSGLPSLFRGARDVSFTTRCVHTPARSHNQGPGTDEKTLTNLTTVQVEYISLTKLVENTLYISKPLNTGNFRKDLFSTFTEFVLGHYFRQHGYPDVLAVYAPFHHEKWHSSIGEAALDIAYVDGLMDLFLPASTEVFWIPDGQECVAKIPKDVPRIMRDNMTTNERLHTFNRLLYEVLSVKLRDVDSGVYGFFDLAKISCPITCQWHVDGAHMSLAWYDIVSNYFLQIALMS